MNETKNLLHTFLRERIHDYRINQKFSIETMAEALQISPRSYIDQEHVYITVKMYPCSGGTDTGSPEL